MKISQKLRVFLRSLALLASPLCCAHYAMAATETLLTTQSPQQTNVYIGSINRELGIKFTSSVGGQINAIRFWKPSNDTGLHVGRVWTTSGQQLASVNFTNETSSGWQQQSLATPLSVAANTVYVVTVNTANRYYVLTPYGLASKIVHNDLSSVLGTDGVIGPAGSFPVETYLSADFFRDVVFTPASPATQPALTSNPANLNFGNVNVGSSGTQAVTLTNTGGGTISISKVAVTGSGFSVAGFTTPLSLAKTSQTTLKVTFTPTVMGTVTGSLSITSTATNATLNIPLSGVGKKTQVSVVPASIAFGSVPVGVTNTQTLTLTDSGNSNLIVSQATVTGTGFGITAPALPATVTPGSSVALTVRFSPVTAGSTSGTVNIASNATGQPVAVPLTGTGTAQTLTLSANPSSLAFGNVSPGSSAKKTVTLSNTGNSSISVSALTPVGSYFSLSGLALPVTLAAGQSSGFTVTFAPTVAGTFSGSVSVKSTAVNSPLTIPLSGTGSASHSVALNWIPSVSSGVLGYSVYRGTVKGGPYTKITSSLVPGSTYSDTSVQNGLTYYYVVASVASSGMQSVYSSEVSATIP
jgi:hypothetical protein